MPLIKSKGYHYGIKDRAKFDQLVDLLDEAVYFDDNGWCNDNLITFGKNVGFLADKKFIGAINTSNLDQLEISILWRTHTVTWAAQQCLAIEGDFVEGGVYRGSTARMVCNYLDFGKLPRTYWLYDRWDVNPDRSRQFGDMGDDLWRQVQARFSDLPNVRVIRGAVPDSFASGIPDSIAFLHLDMNSVAGEIGALEHLFDRMSPGGMIILDDYGWVSFKDQHVAEKAWFAERGRSVLELPTGQGLVIR